MKGVTQHQIQLRSRRVDYRVVHSPTARKLRLRVGPNGVEIVQPDGRENEEISTFMHQNAGWIIAQLRRVEGLRGVRRPQKPRAGEMLFRGEPTRIRIETT